MITKNKNTSIAYIVLILSAVCFMLLFAYNTSPLFEYLGVDSSMYLVMGRKMAEGGTLYADFFDHKGPVIFILNMLPQLLIDGPLGVWLLELSFMIFSVIILYRIAKNHINSSLCLGVSFIYLLITVTLFNGGNYTEEYSNFFSVLSLWVFHKWQRDKKLDWWMPYLLGVCFAFAFFMRPNNTALTVAVIVFIGITLVRKKQNGFKAAVIWGFLGLFTVTLPLMLYHFMTGTLYDAFYALILHNLKYCAQGTGAFRFTPNGNSAQMLCFFTALLLPVIAMCTCYSSDEMEKGSFFLLAMPLVCFALWIGRHPFLYYWTLMAPLSAYASLFIIKYGFRFKKKVLSQAALVLMVTIGGINSFAATDLDEKKRFIQSYKRSAKELYDQIPSEEKNDCFVYDVSAIFLYEMDFIMPCKYFTMQSWMSEINPAIGEECAAYVADNQPKWLLAYHRNAYANARLSEIIKSGYREVFHNDYGYLYRKADDIK